MESLLVAIVGALLPIINKVHTMALGIRPLERRGIICVEVRHHKGCLVELEDGCEVRPGDSVVKLHFDNAWINGKRSSSSGSVSGVFPRGFGNHFKEGLQLFATEVADGKHGGIVAVYGWTAFHAHARRFGFQVIDLPNSLRTKLARVHVTALMQSHSIPWLKGYSASRRSIEVKAVWLSRAALLRIHGPAS